MKNIIRVITVSSSFIIGMGLVGAANAAETINGNANILIALSLQENTALNFGSFAHDNKLGGGSIIVGTDNTVTSSVNIDSITPVASGLFGITGEPNQVVTITLPASATLTHTNGENDGKLDLSQFTNDKGGSVTLNENGEGAFAVGAKLAFDAIASDKAGAYVGTYSVTIDYQ